MEKQNAQEITALELRKVAQFVEDTTLDLITNYSSVRFPLARGDLKDFPRPSSQDQAAQQGFVILRESSEQTIAKLYALAAALDNNLPVAPALLLSVQPYVAIFRDVVREQQEEPRRAAGEESNERQRTNPHPEPKSSRSNSDDQVG
jgi:hypothetical protein